MKERSLYENREISWIKFNERVLEEAENSDNPLFERLKFMSIFSSNFDEFFRVRLGTLCDRILVDEEFKDDKQGKSAKEQIKGINKQTKKLMPRFDAAYFSIMEALASVGTEQVDAEKLTAEEKAFLKNCFEKEIGPVISPYIIEKRHPFPFFQNGQGVVGVTLRSKNNIVRFGLIPIHSELPRLIFLPLHTAKFILIEDLIKLFAHKIFHKFVVEEKAVFSIIRNADIDENEGLYEYDVDFRDTMSKLIERRSKLAPVKLKYVGEHTDKLITHLKKVLSLEKGQIQAQKAPLKMKFLEELEAKYPKEKFTELYYPHLTPQKNPQLDETMPIIDQILKKDVLLSYPFHDIGQFITLLQQASTDERVTAIKMSLYRVAANSKIVHALIEAAKNGKDITCVVELRARFDEENNIDWSKRLEEAGCKVVYGLPNFKVHCKLLLITLNDGQTKHVCQVGTGNFNEITAKLYTDLALLTANEPIVQDVMKTFEQLELGRFVESSESLLVAPLLLKTKLLDLIDEEIAKKQSGKQAGIILKMNSLTDKQLIDKLIEASKAGIRVQMIIRGICCLVPGIKDETDNIEIRSIVGRFLEHSRIYAFGSGRARKYFISSADFMTRNTTQRVEAAVPIFDRAIKTELAHILRVCLNDNVKASILKSSGKYIKPKITSRSVLKDSQLMLYREAYAKAVKK